MPEEKTCPICDKKFTGDTQAEYAEPTFEGQKSFWWQEVQYCSEACMELGRKQRFDPAHRLTELETKYADLDSRLKSIEGS